MTKLLIAAKALLALNCLPDYNETNSYDVGFVSATMEYKTKAQILLDEAEEKINEAKHEVKCEKAVDDFREAVEPKKKAEPSAAALTGSFSYNGTISPFTYLPDQSPGVITPAILSPPEGDAAVGKCLKLKDINSNQLKWVDCK